MVIRKYDNFKFPNFRGSIVVSIPACHAGNPGSIPGLGAFFVCEQKCWCDGFMKKKYIYTQETYVLEVTLFYTTTKSPRRDSNPQSLPPEGSALSIRPQGQFDRTFVMFCNICDFCFFIQFLKINSKYFL